MDVVLLAIALQVAGGLGAALAARSPRTATVFGAGAAVLGCMLGLVPAVSVLLGGAPLALELKWDATHGPFRVGVDPLSAFFLVPVLGLSALAAVYGSAYLFAYRREKSLGPPWFFFNVFVAGMVLVLIARTALLFLMAWEVMSLAAYCLVVFEHEKAEVRRAGWVYLIATHLGVIFLITAFLLLGRGAGNLGVAGASVVFVLALIGFGTKAGLVPFHVWLPEAHPAAPSHVSALMSGVMIKMGVYGIVRVVTFLQPPAPWWGLSLAGLGLLTGLVGIALALNARDVKRVLAYSSIENMGLIALSLGVGLWGWASGLRAVAVLGTAAAFFHVWNHALMKGLQFFAAGSILHGTGTKDMEHLGGLLKRMPWTGTAMMTGAVAIAALPPLNGFAGKWLMYLSLWQCSLSTGRSAGLTAIMTIGLLALIGGLAAITFVRLTGIVLLGSPRSASADKAHESSPWLLAPIYVLVVLCLGAAVVPQDVVGLLAGPLDQVLGAGASRSLLELQVSQVPLHLIGNMNAWILIVSALAAVGLTSLTRRAARAEAPTWGCGFARPTVRMQYTGRSFTEMIAGQVLPRFLRPRIAQQAPRGLFPGTSTFGSECPDPVSRQVYEPFARRWADRFVRLRFLQRGKVRIYLVYIMVTVVLALAWATLRTWRGTP